MPRETKVDLQAKLVIKYIKLLKTDGSWHDVTVKHDKSAKADLLKEIEHLSKQMLRDYEDLRERYK